jgi:predicted RNase H-like HicB family nuclease
MENKYSINIFWSDEDNCFIATIPEFPNLSAFGGNLEEVIAESKQVLGMAIESLARDGIPIPEPKIYIPQEYSGQVRLRMPKSLHGELVSTAEKEGVSLNTHMISLLSKNNTVCLIREDIKIELEKLIKHQDENFSVLHRKIGRQEKEEENAQGWANDSWRLNKSQKTQIIVN